MFSHSQTSILMKVVPVYFDRDKRKGVPYITERLCIFILHCLSFPNTGGITVSGNTLGPPTGGRRRQIVSAKDGFRSAARREILYLPEL
jgi:hypothetical protein